MSLDNVLVLGAGTMGAGIAQLCSLRGLHTKLFDPSAGQLKQAETRIQTSLMKGIEKGKLTDSDRESALSNLTLIQDKNVPFDVAIEAIPEDVELKKSTFAELGKANPSALLASNTSSLSITEIAAAAPHPHRVVGLHFFNPAPIMPLLEVVQAEQTAEITVQLCLQLAERLNKTPIVVKDRPGFATSRLGLALGLEAIRMVETGVASVADIDAAMSLGYRHPMGPLELTDLVGLDVRLAIAEHLTRELGPRFQPPPLLRQLVRAGKLGKKTGEGFYRWKDGRPVAKGKKG